MTRFLRAALLAATIALTATPAAAKANTYTVGYILQPGQSVMPPWMPAGCDASNLAATWVYHKWLYASLSPYYKYWYWDYYGSPRAVFDIPTRTIENRGTVPIRVWCWWP